MQCKNNSISLHCATLKSSVVAAPGSQPLRAISISPMAIGMVTRGSGTAFRHHSPFLRSTTGAMGGDASAASVDTGAFHQHRVGSDFVLGSRFRDEFCLNARSIGLWGGGGNSTCGLGADVSIFEANCTHKKRHRLFSWQRRPAAFLKLTQWIM